MMNIRVAPPRPYHLLLLVASIALSAAQATSPARAADVRDAKQTFSQRCTACHTFGRGVKVGPDLKGVTERRARPWLLRFVRSSQTVINGGDPVAVALFQQFKQERMPDWTDLSEAQIAGLLDWLAANGPEQKEPDERHAELASTVDLQRARALFHGRETLTSGGLPCASCHSIRDQGARRGGSMGPDLTSVYGKYQDRALTLFLKKPCSLRAPEIAADRYLTPQESFVLKAYLRSATLSETTGRAAQPAGGSARPPAVAAPPQTGQTGQTGKGER